MSEPTPSIACRLSALAAEEQTRRADLAGRIFPRFVEIRETSDGYSARLDPDPALFRDALEWLLLERRCCPFLRMEMRLDPAEGPLWMSFGGGAGVKEFLAAEGLGAGFDCPDTSCGPFTSIG